MTSIVNKLSNQHQDLLELIERVKNDEVISKIRKFLKQLANAGTEVTDGQQRSQLRGLILFWSDFIYEHTGQFPKVQLLPAVQSPEARTEASGPHANKAKIALWGPSNSGKTTYIVSIFTAGMQSDSGWIVRPGDRRSTEFILDAVSGLRGEDELGNPAGPGEFPSATVHEPEPIYYDFFFAPEEHEQRPPDGTLQVFWSWLTSSESKDEKTNSFLVSFADVAGEQYLRDSIDDPLWNHLAESDGIICLLDPNEANSSFRITSKLLQTLWLKLMEDRPHLMRRHKLPHHIAFCFTKMDRKDYYPFIEQPDKLLRTIANSTGTHLDKLIGQYVSSERIEYFGISAIGVDEETQESLVDEGTNTIRNPEKIRPINILEPLGWLFHELFFV